MTDLRSRLNFYATSGGSLKIAVSGVHSTGKTTILRRLEGTLQEAGIECATVSDLASQCPLPILRDHTPESALWIVAAGITDEVKAGSDSSLVLVDRPVIDAWAYLAAALGEDSSDRGGPVMDTLAACISNWLESYDLILATELDESLPIADDGRRDLDPDYRRTVNYHLQKSYIRFGVKPMWMSAQTAVHHLAEIVEILKRWSTL